MRSSPRGLAIGFWSKLSRLEKVGRMRLFHAGVSPNAFVCQVFGSELELQILESEFMVATVDTLRVILREKCHDLKISELMEPFTSERGFDVRKEPICSNGPFSRPVGAKLIVFFPKLPEGEKEQMEAKSAFLKRFKSLWCAIIEALDDLNVVRHCN